MAFTKCIIAAGQSNAHLMMFAAPPANCAVSRVGIDSAALGVNFGPWPFGWGPTNPYGWRTLLAQEIIAVGRSLITPSIIWFQGEADASAVSNHYATDLLELVSGIDTLVGHTRTKWGMVRLNIAFAGEAPVGAPLVRTGFATAVSAIPTRAFLIDVDDLTPNGSAHYNTGQYNTIWGRHKTGMATLTGDSSWAA